VTSTERTRRWRENHPERAKEISRAQKKRLRRSGKRYGYEQKLQELLVALKDRPCRDCGHEFPTCCMDFDHRPGTIKAANVGTLFAQKAPVDVIMTEVRKCDLVCSNCHRIRTWKRRRAAAIAC
jgi:hypothetical protein